MNGLDEVDVGRKGARRCVQMLLALAFGLGLVAAGPQMGTRTAYAQVTTTTVADTVYYANGTAATGTVIVSWPAFSTMNGAGRFRRGTSRR